MSTRHPESFTTNWWTKPLNLFVVSSATYLRNHLDASTQACSPNDVPTTGLMPHERSSGEVRPFGEK